MTGNGGPRSGCGPGPPRLALPASRYSDRFRIAINTQVAHSPGLRPAVNVTRRELRAGDAIE